ncbi:MAG TPA: tetratricopeptide repeat protein [Deltaproteobacteria bacterium]|nr:tetratricopeptide repeat protein [Deltaproteobacteria bacterium]
MRWFVSTLFAGSLALQVGCSAKRAEYRALSHPEDADAWEKLGNAYRRQLKGDRAADAYREAIRIDPSREHLASRLSGHPSREAKAMRREALKHPNDDEIWGDLGDLLRYDGDLLGARQAYMRAFRIDPNDNEWHTALVELGAVDLVLASAEETLSEADDESLGDYADLLAQAGRQEEACEHWRRAAELDPQDEEWIGHAMECGYPVPEDYNPYVDAYDTGSYMGGIGGGGYEGLPGADDISGLVERVHNDAGLLVRLGQAYLQADDREKAEETLWSALLVAPTDEEALQSFLVASRRTRRQVLESLRDTFPEDDEVIGTLADHYLDLGLRDRARDLYNLAHDLDGDDPEWRAKRQLLEGSR